ncbi:MAG: amidohydrolase family protein [Egibacteraceae bacterium]
MTPVIAPVVDAHLHTFRAVSDRYPRDVHELFPADLEAPVEDYLATMDRHGIDHAVLVPLSPHDEYLRECLELEPQRFAGIGVHDSASRDPVANLHRRVEETGIQGLRVHHLGDPATADVTELETFPLLSAMADVGHKLWFYGSSAQLQLLGRVLDALPRLVVVLNHLGFCQQGYLKDAYGRPRIATELPPPTLPTVERYAAFEHVHVMFSGEYAFSTEPFPFDDLASTVRALHAAYGSDRLLWASDYPWIVKEPGYGPQMELVDHYLPGLEEDERAAIMGGNAARLFGFGGLG